MANRVDDKLYRVKVKDGSHLNEKTKEDGSRAGIQFDEKNDLQGPVDLIEVDASELYENSESDDMSNLKSLWSSIVADTQEKMAEELPQAVSDIVTELTTTAVNFVIYDMLVPLGKYMVYDVAIPATKKGASYVATKISETHEKNKIKRVVKKKYDVLSKAASCITKVDEKSSKKTILHTPEEIENIQNEIINAAWVIYQGINELSQTAILDETNEEYISTLQTYDCLTSKTATNVIDYLLAHSMMIDCDSLITIKEFKRNNFIINDKVVPISNYINV